MSDDVSLMLCSDNISDTLSRSNVAVYSGFLSPLIVGFVEDLTDFFRSLGLKRWTEFLSKLNETKRFLPDAGSGSRINSVFSDFSLASFADFSVNKST